MVTDILGNLQNAWHDLEGGQPMILKTMALKAPTLEALASLMATTILLTVVEKAL
jgi:hypothetical protein